MFGRKRTRIVGNLRVGKADVSPSRTSHTRGVREGNKVGMIAKEPGMHPIPHDDRRALGSAERSTGINAKARQPIDPRMPNISPS